MVWPLYLQLVDPLKQTNDRTGNEKNAPMLTTERNGTREIALSEGLSG